MVNKSNKPFEILIFPHDKMSNYKKLLPPTIHLFPFPSKVTPPIPTLTHQIIP